MGVTTAKRVSAVPDVPTIAESALPGFESSQWFGILAPARTPRPIVDRLYEALTRASNSPEIKGRLSAEGVEVVNRTPGIRSHHPARDGAMANVIKAAASSRSERHLASTANSCAAPTNRARQRALKNRRAGVESRRSAQK